MKSDQDRQILVALAAFVRAACAQERLTQRELARRSGLRRELIGRISRAQANPSITILAKVAHGLGVSMGELGAALERSEKINIRLRPDEPGRVTS